MTVRYVGVGAAGQQVGITDGVLQQAEEDGGHACPRHAVIGTDCTVWPTDDIGIVVIGEQRRHCGLGIVDSDPAVFACIGRVLAPAQSVALRRHGLDPVVIAALGDLCLCPAVPVGLVDAEPCIGSGPDTPQLKFRAAQRRTVPGIKLGEPERVAGVVIVAAAVACPLRVQMNMVCHRDRRAGDMVRAAPIALSVPADERVPVADVAVFGYHGQISEDVAAAVNRFAGVRAVSVVSHGIGLGGHPGPADAGGDHDRGDGTAAGYFAADMGGGVQRFTGGESCCIQKTGAFQHHLDGGFSRNRGFPTGQGGAGDGDRMAGDTGRAVEDAVTVEGVKAVSAVTGFGCETAVQFHNKGHGRDIGRCHVQHTAQAVRHGVGHGIGDLVGRGIRGLRNFCRA